MSNAQNILIGILFEVVVFKMIDRIKRNKEAYPLQKEVSAIEREFYLHYLATGEYPKDRDFLSQYSRNIIAAYPDRFRWDDEGVYLHFKPIVPYTFAPVTIGKPGEMFEHNSKVFWAHAPWYEGFRDHYEASPEEMRNAGVTIDP